MSKNKFSAEKIHKYCLERWEHYKQKDGIYLPSKHDKQVFDDASKQFNISASACEYWFNKIDKPIAKKRVEDAIKNGEFNKLCSDIIVGNGESPWGKNEILMNFYTNIEKLQDMKMEAIHLSVEDERGVPVTDIHIAGIINIVIDEMGDIQINVGDNTHFVFKVNAIASVMKSLDTDKVLKLLMKNGNITTLIIEF